MHGQGAIDVLQFIPKIRRNCDCQAWKKINELRLKLHDDLLGPAQRSILKKNEIYEGC